MAAPLPLPQLLDEWLRWAEWTSSEPRDEAMAAELIGWHEFDWAVQDYPELAWQAIVTALEQPRMEAHLGLLAAGPVEDLLSKHGPAFIDRGLRATTPRLNAPWFVLKARRQGRTPLQQGVASPVGTFARTDRAARFDVKRSGIDLPASATLRVVQAQCCGPLGLESQSQPARSKQLMTQENRLYLDKSNFPSAILDKSELPLALDLGTRKIAPKQNFDREGGEL